MSADRGEGAGDAPGDAPGELDIRTLSIIWIGEESSPTLEFSGCSEFEAIGLALVAVARLIAGELHDDDDEGDDDDD